jgi:hypothetical protein
VTGDDQSMRTVVDDRAAPVGALTGNPGIASYIASKHGVVGRMRFVAWQRLKRPRERAW